MTSEPSRHIDHRMFSGALVVCGVVTLFGAAVTTNHGNGGGLSVVASLPSGSEVSDPDDDSSGGSGVTGPIGTSDRSDVTGPIGGSPRGPIGGSADMNVPPSGGPGGDSAGGSSNGPAGVNGAAGGAPSGPADMNGPVGGGPGTQ
ncbi:hypothetical protein P3F83_12680 [Mycobacteroides immunogenum]|uniref:hypothetical protein n=1 Tax=Mycobacteroides immunogenum TaxID=83262 RepID=UPI0025B74ED2|nr:hypothetical protein [Mycobacteroides immunogenum]WJR36121.1 hypothetical protein P3F83_12680 [Mycobacteroides immunogenum]